MSENERSQRQIEKSNEVIARIGTDATALAQRRELALALMDKGLALQALGRDDEALTVYDVVVAQFGDDADAEITRRVAWAFVDKGIALGNLDRAAEAVTQYDEAFGRIAQMGDPSDDLLAGALLNKAESLRVLGRYEQTLELCSVAAERFCSGADRGPEHRDRLARALMIKASAHRDAGDQQAAIATYDQVLAEFHGDDTSRVRRRVAWAFVHKCDLLFSDRRFEDALEVADAMLGRFGDSADGEERGCVHETLRVKGDLLRWLGREAEAVIVYDSANALGDRLAEELDEPVYVEWSARNLFEKASALLGLDRDEEAIAAREAAFALLEPEAPAWLYVNLGLALVAQTVALETLGERDRAAQVPNTARALLGGPAEAAEASADPRPSDERVAQLLAETLASDCFDHFASIADDRPRETYAARAVALYRETVPVLIRLHEADEELDGPAISAVMVLRSIADAYALLSRDGPMDDAVARGLPNPARMASAVSMSGLDQWAEDHEHPLPPLAADEEQALDGTWQPRDEADEWEVELAPLARAFVNTLRVYDVIAAIRGARGGRDLLRESPLRDHAVDYVEVSLGWMQWLEHYEPDGIIVGLAMLLVAQSWHVAGWTERPLQDEWFPSRAFLREFLAAPDGLTPLTEEGVELPGWMQ